MTSVFIEYNECERPMEFKEKVEAFKESCKTFKREKELIQEIDPEEDALLARFVQEDIAFVENTFRTLEERCGTNAVHMIQQLFLEDRTQLDVAHEFDMSRRQLQYSVDRWMHSVFEDA